MAYDEILAGRIAESLRKVKTVETRKRMGGLCLMIYDKMALGISGVDLIDPDDRADGLSALRLDQAVNAGGHAAWHAGPPYRMAEQVESLIGLPAPPISRRRPA